MNFKTFIEDIKSNKSLQIKCGIIAMAVVAVIIILIVLMSVLNTVHLTDYITITEVEGYDGYATVNYNIDEASLYQKIGLTDKEINSNLEGMLGAYSVANELNDGIEITIENNGKFSNGDTAKIEITFNSKYDFGKKIRGGTLTQKIEGLDKVKTLDLFEDFTKLVFDGKNGSGTIIPTTNEDELDDFKKGIVNEILYTTDNDGCLKNGDNIIVTATVENYENVNSQLLTNGYAVKEKQERKYTVEGLWTLLEKTDLTEQQIKELETVAKANLKADEIKNIYVYWADINDEDSEYGNAVFVSVDYRKKLILLNDYFDTFAFYDCRVLPEETNISYEQVKRIDNPTIFYEPENSTEVLNDLKRKFPKYSFTTIK